MKKYNIYFTDFPWDPMKCEAINLYDATEKGWRYIRAWNLDAVIDRIEEVD